MSLLVSEDVCGCWVEFVPSPPPRAGGHYIRHTCRAEHTWERLKQRAEEAEAEVARLRLWAIEKLPD